MCTNTHHETSLWIIDQREKKYVTRYLKINSKQSSLSYYTYYAYTVSSRLKYELITIKNYKKMFKWMNFKIYSNLNNVSKLLITIKLKI